MSEVNSRNGGFEYRESGGYDRAQVDSFINEVKKYIAGQKNEKQLLTQKLHVLAVKIQEYQAFESEKGTYEAQVAALKADVANLEARISELKSSESELKAGVDAANAEFAGVSKQLESKKTEAFNLDAAIKAKDSYLSELDARVRNLYNEEGRLVAAAAEEQNAKAEETKSAVSRKLAALCAEVSANVNEIEAILEKGSFVTVEVGAAPEIPVIPIVAEKPEAVEVVEDSAPAVVSEAVLTVADLLAENESEAEISDEVVRLNRDAAKSVLRSVAGIEEDENGPTKLMPEGIAAVSMIGSSENSVDIVINARESEETEEETGWCAPEDSVEDEAEHEEAKQEAVPEKVTEPETVAVLTAEEAEGLSYDDALALVFRKNGIEYKAPSRESAVQEVEEKRISEDVESAPATIPEKPKKAEEKAPAPEKKKEKKGFFAALKRNIDAILEDDDDEEDEEFTGTEVFTPDTSKKDIDQPTLRFGSDDNDSKK